ncbi:hypothetical protein IMG5_061220 [Ichthyophthirius multifiliis]|uniref:Serine aminopeptidase S33 domain-containing protein n=1 Tax=Ichthyophthirius multifiliis TaxID=5932 RepID=G0QNT2_ICHMU|nr:hypothetical protein IMG5_061220 [Ichthyophthirius multifiliis]EGR33123.1 hypothetical protein IMG5_061220 [Ichthyophthirius multifiliis]|eukprot:XP_004037109.1 hypothetical protein IMG5_061220 [Ichthyophthirius multifiliis]
MSFNINDIQWQNEEYKDNYMKQVMDLKQLESDRSPVPGQDSKYEIENWIDFNVIQENKVIKLATYKQRAQNEIKAVLIIFHGLNSHIGQSSHIAEFLSKKGIEVVGYDFRGFGKSEGIRGYCESVQQHIEDANKFVSLIENIYSNKKIFIAGQSWGGSTVYKLSLDNPNRFQGVILYAPAIKDNKYNSRIGKFFVGILASIYPKLHTLPQRFGLSNKNLNVPDELMKDPYAYNGNIIVGTIKHILNLSSQLENTYKDYKARFLCLTAGKDKLVDPLLGFQLNHESPSEDKTHIFYNNCWHNMWKEQEIYEMNQVVADWILKRI